MPPKEVLLIVDPVGGTASVQYNLLSAIARKLATAYRLTLFTPFCSRSRRVAAEQAGFSVFTPGRRSVIDNRITRWLSGSNESMLWVESWMRETLFGANESAAQRLIRSRSFDYIVNLSMTVPAQCDLWWIQGTPLDLTIRGMSTTNRLAQVVDRFGSTAVRGLDRRLVHRIRRRARRIAANSPFLADFYRRAGCSVDGVLYSFPDFSAFKPSTPRPSRDYVLTYVGKETEDLDFRALRRLGVRVVGFGAKVPSGAKIGYIRRWTDFRGYVTQSQLVDLYSNALFTLFPFTWEPLGCVPVESMACGTPVLTYSRQGPGATVIQGRTGWLVNDLEQIQRTTVEIWKRGGTDIDPGDCVQRAKELSATHSVGGLVEWIEGRTGN